MMWWFERNIFGPGICTLIKENNYSTFFQSCDNFEYSPIKNEYGIETPEFIDEWRKARRFESDMYNDILTERARIRAEEREKQDLGEAVQIDENGNQIFEDYKETRRLKTKIKNIRNHRLNA